MAGKRMVVKPAPLEEVEQRMLAQWLDMMRLQWLHVPNGGKRPLLTAVQLKRAGVKVGAPDCLLFDPPPNAPGCVGTALELKREKGGTVSAAQHGWLKALRERGWHTIVAHGASDAIKALQEAGYGRR